MEDWKMTNRIKRAKEIKKYLLFYRRALTFVSMDFVAQLVEQLTLNQWVESSSLSGVTQKSHFLAGK